jgi:xanthine/CO dehydrogenase XdhC/CoxF family maturation factor
VSRRRLLEDFGRWRQAGEPLVLVTVVETAGSTYTKAGHRILMAATGEFTGLVSGGCLEGDLLAHARGVLASRAAAVVTYDLRGEQDELFGLGIGCNGLLRLLLQPVTADQGYEPFATIAAAMAGDTAGVTATIVEPGSGSALPGTTATIVAGATSCWPQRQAWLETIGREHPVLAAAGTATGPCAEQVLVAPLHPLPRLLLVGGGLDAVPLVAMAAELGWRVTVADHRPANLARGDFPAADRVELADVADLAARLPLDAYAAVVVMSHHLDTDRRALAALATSRVPYIGLLGPAGRRDRLLRELGAAAAGLLPRLRAPAGLAMAADSPAAIALAILGEIQGSGVAARAGTH